MSNFIIEFGYETNLTLEGHMGKKGMQRQQELKREFDEMIQRDPVGAGERRLAELQLKWDRAMPAINSAAGDAELIKALTRAGEAWLSCYGFGHDMHMATGQTKYEQKLLTARLTPYQLRLWHTIKRNMVRSAVPGAAEIIAAIKASKPQPDGPPRSFSGEHEWQEYLRQQGLTESDSSDHESRTLKEDGPSPE
jgi:hypothetical protein